MGWRVGEGSLSGCQAARFARVRAALRAEALRSDAVRLRAAFFACLTRAVCVAALLPSRFNALVTAFERLADGFDFVPA